MVEEIILDMESSLTLDLQPPSSIDLQIADDEVEVEKQMRVVTLSFEDNLLSKCIPAHQPDDLHTVKGEGILCFLWMGQQFLSIFCGS